MNVDSPETLSRRAADLHRAGRYEEALNLSLSLAESSQAPPWILSMIGTMYFHGRGTKINQEEGLRWYRRAADAGDPGALTFLSSFQQGAGRYAEAKTMLEEAAAQGYTRALIQLGYLYDHGLGVPRDPKRAREYFEQAAGQGYVFAKRFIASQLLRGDDGPLGVPRGVLMFVSALFEGVIILIKDRYSDKAKR
jgi:TPR repeat protein